MMGRKPQGMGKESRSGVGGLKESFLEKKKNVTLLLREGGKRA